MTTFSGAVSGAVSDPVSDEVWRRLPVRRLPRRRVMVVVLVVMALGGCVVAGLRSGLLAPALTTTSVGYDVKQGSHRLGLEVEIKNTGRFTVTLEQPRLTARWLTLDAVTLSVPPAPAAEALQELRLRPGQTVRIRLAVTVADCAAVRRSGSRLSVEAKGPIRTTRVTLRLGGETAPDAPSTYSYTGNDPWRVPWPVTPVARACSIPLPGR